MTHDISITGATGFIGRHLVESLSRQEGVNVRALAFNTPDNLLQHLRNVTWVRGDLNDPGAVSKLCVPGGTLIHLAYPAHWSPQMHFESIARMAQQVMNQGIKRVIHCSTAVVVGSSAVQRVTEETPLLPKHEYEKTKIALETEWLKQASGKFDLAIARPTAVFGPGSRNLLSLANALTTGSTFVNYLRSSLFGVRRMNLVCVENVVSAIEFLAAREAAFDGSAFLISDDDDPFNNFRDVERILIQELGVDDYPLPSMPVPSTILELLLLLAGRSNANPGRIYDGSKLLNTGWRKIRSLEEGLKAFAAWYKTGRGIA